MYPFLAKNLQCQLVILATELPGHIYNVDFEIKAVYNLEAVVLMFFPFPQEELWDLSWSCYHLSSKLHEQAADY